MGIESQLETQVDEQVESILAELKDYDSSETCFDKVYAVTSDVSIASKVAMDRELEHIRKTINISSKKAIVDLELELEEETIA